MNDTVIFILPGWQDSGPRHWQSLWLKKYPKAIKVVQKDWLNPKKKDWVETLDEYLEKYKNEEIVLVAHSLACPAIAFWALEHPDSKANIKGAILVAPADTAQDNFPKDIQGFYPIPTIKLPFKSIVITSENDPYVTLDRARYFSKKWGSELVNIGMAGHIGTEDGFGEWKQGEEILNSEFVV